MRLVPSLATSLVMALLATACMSSPEDVIVGTWHEIDGTEVLQFLDDGEVIQEDSGGSIGGHYRFIDDRHIRVDFGGPAVYAPPRTYRVELTENTLALTNEKNVTTNYRRTEHIPTIDTDLRRLCATPW
jgi:hypothetical protein